MFNTLKDHNVAAFLCILAATLVFDRTASHSPTDHILYTLNVFLPGSG